MTRDGGCLCGAIRYRVSGDALASGLCHCETCRRAASAPTLPFAVFPRARFVLLRGNPREFRSSPQVTRSFCPTCGSPLTYASDAEPDTIDVMTGSLDEPGALPPTFSVWTSQKVAWDVPNPHCPAYPRTRTDGGAAEVDPAP